MTFRTLTLATSVLSSTLFLVLLLAPGLIFALFGIESATSAAFLARRAAMLFLGFAVLSYLARDAPHSIARQAIMAGVGTTMSALALLGGVELARGAAGAGSLVAIAGETAFAVANLWVWRQHRASQLDP